MASKAAEKEKPPESNGVVERVRPLTATAARSLKELIENDFEMLRQEITELHSARVKTFVREMQAEADPEVKERARAQGEKAIRAFERSGSASSMSVVSVV